MIQGARLFEEQQQLRLPQRQSKEAERGIELRCFVIARMPMMTSLPGAKAQLIAGIFTPAPVVEGLAEKHGDHAVGLANARNQGSKWAMSNVPDSNI